MLAPDRRGLLEVLDANGRRALLARARFLRVRKGQVVLSRGEPAGDVYLVLEGRLNIVLYSADGTEVSLRQLHERQLFGELAAIDGEERSAGIVAASDVRLLVIRSEVFRAVINDYPSVANWLVRRLTSQIRSLTNRVFELSTLSVRTRLHCELIRLAKTQDRGIDLSPSHAELASRIGSHREAVTRELKVLTDMKIIRSGRRRLEFLDIARLEDLVSASVRNPVGEMGWW
jgi:CRP-like cAMP-binding protein